MPYENQPKLLKHSIQSTDDLNMYHTCSLDEITKFNLYLSGIFLHVLTYEASFALGSVTR